MTAARIGLLFTFNPVWMGGVIYLQNLVRTLNFLDDGEKPTLTVYHKPELKGFVDELEYPGLQVVPIDYPDAKLGTLRSWLSRRNVFLDPLWQRNEVDVVFPAQDFPFGSRKKAVAWFADLQHRHYPEFFTRMNRLERDMRVRFMLRHSQQLIVSSQAVADDFRRFYPVPEHLRIDIHRFVSPIRRQDASDVSKVLQRYGIDQSYFIVSNQFHKHKNHRTLIKAFGLALSGLGDSRLVITGRPPRLSDSPYMRELHEIIEHHHIADRVLFLGAIAREDQLALMQAARAVVQPSLFEGWSTVIEDAKSLQVPVIASDLPVHREQLGESGTYFPANDSEALAKYLVESASCDLDREAELYEHLDARAVACARRLLGALAWRADERDHRA